MCGTYKEESEFLKDKNNDLDNYCKKCRQNYIFLKDYEKTRKARLEMDELDYCIDCANDFLDLRQVLRNGLEQNNTAICSVDTQHYSLELTIKKRWRD